MKRGGGRFLSVFYEEYADKSDETGNEGIREKNFVSESVEHNRAYQYGKDFREGVVNGEQAGKASVVTGVGQLHDHRVDYDVLSSPADTDESEHNVYKPTAGSKNFFDKHKGTHDISYEHKPYA